MRALNSTGMNMVVDLSKIAPIGYRRTSSMAGANMTDFHYRGAAGEPCALSRNL